MCDSCLLDVKPTVFAVIPRIFVLWCMMTSIASKPPFLGLYWGILCITKTFVIFLGVT